MPKPKSHPFLNDFQIFVATHYGDGDYRGRLVDESKDYADYKTRLAAVDDLVFQGLMTEAGSESGVEGPEDFVSRLQAASDEIDQMIQIFYQNHPKMSP